MTKEALKYEAEEKAKKRTKGFKCQENCETSYVMGALDFAEPREKRIAELKEKIDVGWHDLKKDEYDVPKDIGMVFSDRLILVTNNLDLILGVYDFINKKFRYSNFNGVTDIIAWKELMEGEFDMTSPVIF